MPRFIAHEPSIVIPRRLIVLSLDQIMIRYQTLLVAVVLLSIRTVGSGAAEQTDLYSAEQPHVIEVIRSFFAAATADDLEKFNAVTSPNFYAFDAGGRFTRDALIELIKAAHAAGKFYVWTVNEPEVHILGDTAWITYVNHGSIKDTSGTKEATWLESAFLEKEKGTWRIHFFHSTRVPEKK
jgi:ketosteroid isomerase-like protein